MESHGSHGGSHVLHWARAYDVLVSVLSLGREGRFRARLLDLARLSPGESVLDVGCGTGTLAIAARQRVGPAGEVWGVDPSPEMVARATRKAAKAGVDVRFETGALEELPLRDGGVDVVLSSLMLHHLTDDGRVQGMGEIVRVLKPGGRFLAVDIGRGPDGKGRRGLLERMPRTAHADFDLDALPPVVEGAGMDIVDRGPVGGDRVLGLSNLRFMLAAKGAHTVVP